MHCISTLPSTFCLVQASAASALYHHLTIHFLLGTSKCSKYIVSPSYHLLFAWYKQVQQVHCITILPSTFCLVQASAASALYHHLTLYLVQQMHCITTLPSTFCLVQASAASAMYLHLTIHCLLGTSKCSKCIVSPPYHPLFAWYKQVQQVHCIGTLPSTFCLVQESAASALYHHLTIHFLLGTSKCRKCIVSPPYHLLFTWYKQVQQEQCITTLPSTFCLVQASAANTLYHHFTIHFLLGTSKCNVSPPYHLLFAWYKQVQQVHCITTLPSTVCLVQASAMYHHPTIYFLLGTSKCSKCTVSPPYHPLFAWYKQVQQVHCITTLPSTFAWYKQVQ